MFVFIVLSTLLFIPSLSYDFSQPIYHLKIQENAGPKTYCESDRKIFIQTLEDDVDFKLVEEEVHGGSEIFKVEKRKIGVYHCALIRTKGGTTSSSSLNRERTDSYIFSLQAIIRSQHQETITTAKIVITVEDVDDHPPYFLNPSFEVNIFESTPVGTTLFTVSAVDSDQGRNGDLYYTIVDKNQNQFFIDSHSGDIVLVRPLSFNKNPLIHLTVLIDDRGQKNYPGASHTSSSHTLIFRVQQNNTEGPIITLTHLPAVIEQGLQGSIYAILKIFDNDKGKNGEIKSVKIVAGDPLLHFVFERSDKDSVLWNLKIARSLDREDMPDGYNLTIVASDNGNPSKESSYNLLVHVIDTNDNKPVFFQDLIHECSEILPPLTPLFQAQAKDRDIGKNSEIRYEIVSGDWNNEFWMNSVNGWVFKASHLSSALSSKYYLNISATDQANFGSQQTEFAKYTLLVTDENNHAPVTTKTSFAVDEDVVVGSIFGSLSSGDLDRSLDNSMVTYKTIGNFKEFNLPFFVFPNGSLTALRKIDVETMPTLYEIFVRVEDKGIPFSRSSDNVISIQLFDVNDEVPLMRKSTCRVQISFDIEAKRLLRVEAVDPDGKPVKYKIIAGNDDKLFEINSITGDFSLSPKWNNYHLSEITKFKISVVAEDSKFQSEPLLIEVVVNSEIGSSVDCEESGADLVIEKMKKQKQNETDLLNKYRLSDFKRCCENNNKPRIEIAEKRDTFEVNENVAVGTTIFSFHMSEYIPSGGEMDKGFASMLTASITKGNEDACFNLSFDNSVTFTDPNPTTLVDVKVLSPLDRENKDLYSLTLTAYDLSPPYHNYSIEVFVKVLDENDNYPMFIFSNMQQKSYLLDIKENYLPTDPVLQVKTLDLDSDENARVSYKLAVYNEFFSIEESTGHLRLVKQLDREQQQSHVFKVEASDHGSPSLKSHAVVNVTVTDVNDNAPEFYSSFYKLRVPEDYPEGAFIVQVKANDADVANEVTYSFGFGDHHMLKLDSETGVILLSKSLDYESQKVLNLSVIARDSAAEPLSSSANVVIEITDVDENVYAPEFQNESQYVLASVAENQPVGHLVTRVFAVDYDRGVDGYVRYAIVGGDGYGRFSLNPITGEVHTLDVFDRETQQFYWLDIKAHDLAAVPKYSMLFLCVEIQDQNDNPPLPTMPVWHVRVLEEQPVATYVATISATDSDMQHLPSSSLSSSDDDYEQVFHYRIKDFSDGYQYFQVHNGLIRTAKVLDREALSQDVFELEVEISDREFESTEGLTSTAKVVIHVEDTNDHAPEMLYDMNEVFVIPPSEPDQQGKFLLHRVVVVDRDAGVNAELMYSILRVTCRDMEGQVVNMRISVDSFGHIFALDSVPDDPVIIDLNLNVTDKGIPANTKFFRLIINLQQRPEEETDFLMIGQFIESEGRALGRVVSENTVGLIDEISVFSNGNEESDFIRPVILGGNDDNKFAIVGSNLVVAQALDCETKSEYNLVIAASDGVKLSANVTWPIRVLDVNEYSPMFAQKNYTIYVNENTHPGTSIYTLMASDLDCESQVQFELDACLTPHSANHFVVSVTGDIVLAHRLDHESFRSHVLRIRAMDTGGLPEKADYAYVVVVVEDASDNEPVFVTPLYQVQVFDTSVVGSVVTQVAAVDKDRGYRGLVTYRIDKGNTLYFMVDYQTGEVILNLELNQSMVGQTFELSVTAVDETLKESKESATVRITIVTGESSPPLFESSEYQAVVEENRPFGAFVFLVPVICHSTVRFAIIEGDDDEVFDMNPSTGAISVKGNLDFEQKRSYKLEIEATNAAGLKAYTFVKVNLVDVNDNHPVFDKTFFNGIVAEGVSPGTVILSEDEQMKILLVSANDLDAGSNGRIAFEILDEHAKHNFSIDPNTGSLRTRTVLDFEEKQFFTFKVAAHDLGTPPLFTLTDAIVNISITDKNDCEPRFELPAYSVVLYQPTFDGVIVTQTKAFDRDSPAMTKFKYSIVNSDGDDNLFSIDTETGVITASASRSMRRSYSLTVQVEDFPVEPLSALVTVHITVQEALGNYILESSHYEATVVENKTEAQSVAQIVVKKEYEEITKLFRLRNNVDLFTIGLTNGILRTKEGKVFDRETKSSYFLQVEMRMVGVSHRALILVEVTVLDVNDNSPEFVRLPYRYGVKAGSPKSTLIGQVSAIDRDHGENSIVLYRIVNNFLSLFEIDMKDGSLYTRNQVPTNLLQHDLHQVLLVEAFNKNNESMRSVVNVTIEFMPQEAPMFTKSEITVRVPEDTALNAQIAQFEAVSADASRIFYTIEQGDRDQQFDINFLTGWVSITSKLDFEEGPKQYVLIIRAWDSKVSHVYSNARLNVIVMDSNDSPPAFSKPVYRASISEGAAPGTTIVQVIAEDADSPVNAQLQYIIIPNSGSQNFQINETSGVISTKRHLDREKTAEYSLLVQVHDTKHFDVTNVVISVNDINDCTPEFYHSEYKLQFDESFGSNLFCLGKVEAFDLDIVNRDSVFYEIKSGNEENLFHVEKWKGLLYIENSANVFLDSAYNLTLTASDTVHTKIAPVSVSVATINRNGPKFTRPDYYIPEDITEHSEVHISKPFFKLEAFDGDKGRCSQLTYSLIGDRVSEVFRIDKRSGELFLRSVIDREDPDLERVLRVMVSDAMGRHAFTNVHIGVRDINDQIPKFERAAYHAVLYEPIPVGYQVVKVHAVDKDSGSNAEIVYSLSPDQPEDIKNTFQVDQLSGQVYTSRRIGFPGVVASEDVISYQFFVQAADKGSPPNTQDVPVDVYVSHSNRQKREEVVDDEEQQSDTDTPGSRRRRQAEDNDGSEKKKMVGPPKCVAPVEESTIELSETAPLGTVVFQVQTETMDTEPMQYSLMDTPGLSLNAPEVLEVNSTGAVIKKRFFDYQDAPNKVTVVVVAKTSNAFATSCVFYIKVIDENNNAPQFETRMYSITLPEDFYETSADTNRHVITVFASDKDAGANRQINYAMSEEASKGYFDIDANSGRVYVKRSLDRETRDTYMLAIRAFDRGRIPLFDTSVINVTIIDLNDNSPVFAEKETKFEVNEAVPVGTVVLSLQVSDKDLPPNNYVFYYIQNSTAFQNDSSTAGNEDSKFNVNQSTGEVYVHGQLDRERATRYELNIVATDGKFSASKTVKVIITDDNDNPPQCSQNPKLIKIPEDTPVSTPIFDYSSNVVDVDAGIFSTITFSLVVPDGADPPPFHIGPDSGILEVSETLDREAEDKYELWIRATDGGGLSCTIKLTIKLLDVNDNAPRFLGHSEAAVVGTYNINQLITKVRAVDEDLKENKTVQYRLIDSANARFGIDTGSGMISLARLLDQSQEQYILKVQAYDQGSPRLSSTTEITIRVGSSKDKPPKFEKTVYQVFVSEAAEIKSEVLAVQALASDESEKFPISYSIVNGNDKKLFSINGTNGSIFLEEELDFERVRSYELDVYAIQLNDFQKPLSDKCSVLINVTDSNDNAPYFPQAIIERDIPEDTQHGVSVYVAQALDMDFNSSLSYHLVTKTPNFVITADTGVIVVGSALDYEQRTHFTLKIAAYDNGIPQLSGYMQLKINILDVNDNPPRFQEDEYNVHIPEDFPESDVLALIKVTDLDGPENQGPFSFSVVGDYSDKFRVDSNGVLKNLQKLVVGTYKFKVNVIDSGLPPASNEVPVTVEVYKASTEPPTIFNHEVFIMILEDTFPAGKIAELTAIDNDKHDQLSYWVFKPEPGSSIPVNATETGDGSLFFMQDRALLAQTNLDEGQYHLTVKVTDGMHTDNGNVSIVVKQVTHDMLMNAVTIELSEMTPHDFLSAYLVLFQTLMTMTVFKSSNNIEVAVLSVQETEDRNLQVLFCVFEMLPSGKPLYVTRDVVERTIADHMDLIKPKLPIVEIIYDICKQEKTSCENNTVCSSVVDLQLKLGFESYRSYSAKRSSFVTLLHQWSTMCRCNPRDIYCVEKACQDNPCGSGRRCIAVTDSTFRCECLNSDGSHPSAFTNCDYEEEQPMCTSPLCTHDSNPMSFSGSGFVNYIVPSVENFDVVSIRLNFRLDARVDKGEMLSVFGATDFTIIDVDNGHVRLRTNKNTAVNGAKKFNDGVWHYVEAFYDGEISSICVDNIYCASEKISGFGSHDAKVSLSSEMVFVADRMAKRQEISQFRRHNTFDTLTWNDYYRFFGCLDDIFINDERLPNPLDIEAQSNTLKVKHSVYGVTVSMFKNVESKCKTALMTLSSCANNPCFHGGLCRGAGSTYECVCGNYATGSRCETLKTTCGLSPCTSGSICRTLDGSLTNYTCHCPKGIKGTRCESEKFCDPNPCLNGATCDDRPYSFNCQCTSGFYGDRCEKDVDECLTMDTPCENGGTCQNTGGGYVCQCGENAIGSRCEVLAKQQSLTPVTWLFGLPIEVVIAFFIVLLLLLILAVLLVTCVKYRKTKRKLRQNALPLIPYPQYPTTHSHSNQYLPYSKLMHQYPAGYASSGFAASNTAGSTSSITNHSYARLPNFSGTPQPVVFFDRKGRPISPANTVHSSIDYEHFKQGDRKHGGKVQGLRVDLPELGTNSTLGGKNRKMSDNQSTSDNDQHYSTSCYMPVMQYSDGGSNATNRDLLARIEDWDTFEESAVVSDDLEEGSNLMRWAEERTTESPNLTDEPSASSNGDYSRGFRRPKPAKPPRTKSSNLSKRVDEEDNYENVEHLNTPQLNSQQISAHPVPIYESTDSPNFSYSEHNYSTPPLGGSFRKPHPLTSFLPTHSGANSTPSDSETADQPNPADENHNSTVNHAQNLNFQVARVNNPETALTELRNHSNETSHNYEDVKTVSDNTIDQETESVKLDSNCESASTA